MNKQRSGLSHKHAGRALLPGTTPALLQALHIMTRDGALNADGHRKLKQINHLVEQLRPALDDIASRGHECHIVDVGSGKSALGFVLYEAFARHHEHVHIHNVEVRDDLVAGGRALATQLGYARMHFIAAPVATLAKDERLPTRIHLLVALHACDTATDDALWCGLSRGADHLAVVPCCQAELARLLPPGADHPVGLGSLWKHAHHRREFASHTTNVVRALVLQAMGYQVRVTELLGFEHSFKNELIAGRRVHRFHRDSELELAALLSTVGVVPALARSHREHLESPAPSE
jgi:Methyltransferase domain